MQFIMILPLEIAVVLLLFCVAVPFAVVLNVINFRRKMWYTVAG